MTLAERGKKKSWLLHVDSCWSCSYQRNRQEAVTLIHTPTMTPVVKECLALGEEASRMILCRIQLLCFSPFWLPVFLFPTLSSFWRSRAARPLAKKTPASRAARCLARAPQHSASWPQAVCLGQCLL